MSDSYKRLKLACYATNISMSVIGNFPPLLFLTFRSLYGLSYTFLGSLIVVNFFTQLIIDLIFSFFSHKFNIPKTVKFTPVITFTGLLIFAFSPSIFPDAVHLGFILGTIIFSTSGGLAEVLISPVIAAIPSDDPDREMSKLHSIYAWGVVPVVIFSTLYLHITGSENWQYLALIFSIIPLVASALYCGAKIPEIKSPERVSGVMKHLKNRTLWLYVAAIFFGGASECTMAQWASGYLEYALEIPKVVGDILGVTLFSVMLGMGRSLYAKYGKNIYKVLTYSGIGATICYFVAATTFNPLAGILACALTGLCTAMLWPGSLIIASEKFPHYGVFMFALMAAGGDLGASIGPQVLGIITDNATSLEFILKISQSANMSPDQISMKAGLLIGTLLPLCATIIFAKIWKLKTKKWEIPQ